jgi:hypothetical protein
MKRNLQKKKKYFRKKEEGYEKERKKTIGPDGVPYIKTQGIPSISTAAYFSMAKCV